MRILLLEPFFTGSHRAWGEQLARYSRHEIHFQTMEGRYWKWRMHGAAVTMARKWTELSFQPDLILATDMMDVSTYLGLIRNQQRSIPLALYFHENQMAYPWSQKAIRNNNWRHYAFINYASALSADHVFFNSHYNLESFHQEVFQLLKQYQDYRELETVEQIRHKSQVLPLGMDLTAFDPFLEPPKNPEDPPLILWNHRWEHDKNPETFTRLMMTLDEEGFNFRLALLGEAPYGTLEAFEALKEQLGNKIVHYGYAHTFEAYANWLAQADLLPVTADQDFFGGSVVEAIYCDCYPLLPNRLAYPEHIPEGHEDVLYDTFNDLLSKTKGALNNMSYVRSYSLKGAVASYDWQFMEQKYYEAFSACTTDSASVLKA